VFGGTHPTFIRSFASVRSPVPPVAGGLLAYASNLSTFPHGETGAQLCTSFAAVCVGLRFPFPVLDSFTLRKGSAFFTTLADPLLPPPAVYDPRPPGGIAFPPLLFSFETRLINVFLSSLFLRPLPGFSTYVACCDFSPVPVSTPLWPRLVAS